MSAKKQSTLFAFLEKTPTSAEKPAPRRSALRPQATNVKKEATTPAPAASSKRRAAVESDSDLEDGTPMRSAVTKRRCIVESSDEEYQPNDTAEHDDDEDESSFQEEDEEEEDDNEEGSSAAENTTPPKKGRVSKTSKKKTVLMVRSPVSVKKSETNISKSQPMTPLSTNIAESFISSFRRHEIGDEEPSQASEKSKSQKSGKEDGDVDIDAPIVYDHETFDFLKPEKIRDAAKRRPDDPEYDPSTLFVPQKFLEAQTPGHYQWWTIKSQFFDTIIFFKVGKFYELYHMDAVTCVNQLSLNYARGKFAHAGFPEVAYSRFADQLVSRGFKVARVEQTETPDMLEQRTKSAAKKDKKDKVVRREICRITTLATRTFGPLDSCEGAATGEASAKYLMALKQDKHSFGICLVDTAVGHFIISQFEDDEYHSKLRTLMAFHQPVQLLVERGNLSESTKCLINSMLSCVPLEQLTPKVQFFTADCTVSMLCGQNYLTEKISEWPEVLRKRLNPEFTIAKPSANDSIVWSAIGAVLWYLKRCLIDVDILTMKNFEECDPLLKGKEIDALSGEERWRNRHLVLDGVTLQNLNLIPNNASGSSEETISDTFSLYNVINKCSTAFGQRLLREWINKPTCDASEIRKRQDAIAWMQDGIGFEFAKQAENSLKEVPDLLRLLQKVHTLGLKYRAEEHPDSRAVIFDASKFNRRKIKDLLVSLRGFRTILQVVQQYNEFCNDENSSFYLNELIGVGEIPDITEDLKHFENSFDHQTAEEQGLIHPKPGFDAEYDDAVQRVEDVTRELETYRKRTAKELCCSVTFVGNGKNRFQMEIPDKHNIPKKFDLASKRKGFARYYTAELKELIESLRDAEDNQTRLRNDASRRVFADFDSRAKKWSSIADRIAILDVLIGLARFTRSCGLNMCRPEFDYESDKPYIIIEEGVNPCLALKASTSDHENMGTSGSFIPNDTTLGGDSPACMLLTGPNMGGKSTLMRQTAVLAVLAHLGCFVSANRMRLTPIDRIFTRVGANDRIMAGYSTFFMELHEVLLPIRDATKHSLVLVDELGRGTSTHDGNAIALSVLTELADVIKCRTMFSSHFHSICTRVRNNPNVYLAHMACMTEDENEEDPTMERVTFLFRLASGACPKSYGFFAAKLAGIRQDVIRNAFDTAKRIFVDAPA